MAIVVVHMNVCKKTHKITVKQKDDGTFSLHIASDCPEVKDYGKMIGDTLTMEDLTDIGHIWRTTCRRMPYARSSRRRMRI